MKRLLSLLLLSLFFSNLFGQKKKVIAAATASDHSLLWKIEGNGLSKPSYLFGTIHMLCEEDALLSDNLKKIISGVDEVYFEVDLDNMFEILGVMSKMKMKGDTTLKDLLTDANYQKVKKYFEEKSSMFPFSMLETYKPILASSLLEQKSFPCENTAMLEQVIMTEAKKTKKNIKGLETMTYQASVLDDIPYKVQAQQLVSYIDSANTGSGDQKALKELIDAYKEQDLKKLEELMLQGEVGVSQYAETLLFKRNRNWLEKLKSVLPAKSLLVAVGAGHLPGTKGVINLLKEAGFKVTPVDNNVVSTKEI